MLSSEGMLHLQQRSRLGTLLAITRAMALDLLLVNAALLLSHGLVADYRFEGGLGHLAVTLMTPISVVALILLAWRRLYRISPKYMGFYDFLNTSFVGVLLGIADRLVVAVNGSEIHGVNPWAVPILFAFLSTTLLCSWRTYRRALVLRNALSGQGPARPGPVRTLIVGAGDAGEMILRELAKLDSSNAAVVCFVDDNPSKQGMTIHGVPILGTVQDIPSLVEKHQIDEVLITMPSASGIDMRRVFQKCASTRARVRTLPSFSILVAGNRQLFPLVRELEVEDLLRRESVKSDVNGSTRYLSGERVLITGGGGSIGSELARQAAVAAPASLVLLGKGENSIFEIDQELRMHALFQPTPVVCDVRDKQRVSSVFKSQYPSVVFHAAAHKHVPLMEAAPIEAIQNNVFGTLNMVEQSVRHGVKKFILVSTDKAVSPSNVMGATKRVAEMIVGSMAARSDTSFGIVRFGNVLNSRGSLIPTLKRQIQSGGPVTITHPEMTRFFMTIPEAVQLVLKAGAKGDRGEIFILDMGEPMSILELAKDMIRMHGLVPGQDIEIKYVGIRPGEKIHEELSWSSEDLLPSGLDRVHMVPNERPMPWDELRSLLDELKAICDAGNSDEARRFLMELAWGKRGTPLPPESAIVEDPDGFLGESIGPDAQNR